MIVNQLNEGSNPAGLQHIYSDVPCFLLHSQLLFGVIKTVSAEHSFAWLQNDDLKTCHAVQILNGRHFDKQRHGLIFRNNHTGY
jgi:hypothetical protein